MSLLKNRCGSDLLADAKARPAEVNVALPSTTARLVLELLQEQSGVKVSGVPYKGSATALTDIIGGQLMAGIDTASAVRQFVASGKLKPLGVTSLQSSSLLPQVKSVSSQGLSNFQVLAWNGLYAPHGTPAAVIQRVSTELTKLLEQPEVRARLLDLGHEAAGGTPKSLADFARNERTKWAPVIKKAGLKAE